MARSLDEIDALRERALAVSPVKAELKRELQTLASAADLGKIDDPIGLAIALSDMNLAEDALIVALQSAYAKVTTEEIPEDLKALLQRML